MEKIDFKTRVKNLKKTNKKKSTAYRFQSIVLKAIDSFRIDKKGQQLLWGRIRIWKKKGISNNVIEIWLLEAANKVVEYKPSCPGRYFLKILYSQ